MDHPVDVRRFLDAQEHEDSHPVVLAELRAGRKRSHWMWWTFPQLRGLGRSATADRYGIADLAEARTYLAHPVLGVRLRECAQALLDQPDDDLAAVLGPVDALKLRSSATLFERAAEGDAAAPFAALLERFCGGARDTATTDLLH